MSLRKIWILSRPVIGTDNLQFTNGVVFSKSFPTCEKRCKAYSGDHYIAIPEDEEFYEGLLIELGWRNENDEFDPINDSCKKYDQKPVFSLVTKKGNLWPIIVLEQYSLLFCCLPLVEGPIADQKPPIINVSSIAVGFDFLLVLSEYLGPVSKLSDEAILNLHLFVNQAAPFGRPVHTSPAAISQILSGRSVNPTPEVKHPSWKPHPHKGKSQLQLTITEFVRSVQYDNSNNTDLGELYATVACRAELEGLSRDVTINFIAQSNQESITIPLDNVLTHPCVQSCDLSSENAPVVRRGSLTPAQRPGHVRFTPGLDSFPLLHYHNKLDEKDLPVYAYYQMKQVDDTAQLLVQLKLNPRMKNSFDYFDVQIPFLARGPIVQMEQSPSQGQVSLSNNKRTLIWSIGQKFPSKTLELLLKATVQFGENTEPLALGTEDSFAVGNNAYAKLFFKVSDFTFSGVTIDTKSVTVTPPVKVKVNLVRELMTSEYRVWNSHGDALIAFPPPKPPS